MATDEQGRTLHPIQVVARRTGLSQDVIRVWERRYGAVEPRRTATNRRLYSDEDVRRLDLLRRATDGGRRIGDVAAVPTDELETLVAADETAASRVARETSRRAEVGPAAAELLAECLEAVRKLDGGRLEHALARAAVALSTPQLLEELLLPLLRGIGDGWHDGSLRIAHEHLASGVVRSFLGTMRQGRDLAGPRAEIVITTPAGQLHELGALMAAVTAGLDGWEAIYLGPSLPAEEIAAAVQQRGAAVVALSIVHSGDAAGIDGELRRVRGLLPPATAIVVGGAGAGSHRCTLQEIGALRVEDLASFRAELARLGDGGG